MGDLLARRTLGIWWPSLWCEHELNGVLLLFGRSVMSDSLWPHGLQHTRLPCPSLSPGVCSNSCPLSGWFHPTISSSVIPFSSSPPSFPASESFPTSQLLTSGGQSIGVSASASVLPINIQCWFHLRLTGLISFLSFLKFICWSPNSQCVFGGVAFGRYLDLD